MSSFAVINIVTELLKDLLKSSLNVVFNNGASDSLVVVKSPKELETGASKTLSLFLYHVLEDAYMKNQPMKRNSAVRYQYPPLALDCYYLLTPYGEESTGSGADANIHRILGRTMQVLYDNSILEGPVLLAQLENMNQEDYYGLIEQIRILFNPLSLDDLTKLWNSLNTPLRLSVSYQVKVIMVESERRQESERIIEKETHYYQVA